MRSGFPLLSSSADRNGGPSVWMVMVVVATVALVVVVVAKPKEGTTTTTNTNADDGEDDAGRSSMQETMNWKEEVEITPFCTHTHYSVK